MTALPGPSLAGAPCGDQTGSQFHGALSFGRTGSVWESAKKSKMTSCCQSLIRYHMSVVSKRARTPAGEALTSLILQLFRVNSLIFSAGDRLAAHLGLTGARWQILGAVIR